jgi:magnesium transporter
MAADRDTIYTLSPDSIVYLQTLIKNELSNELYEALKDHHPADIGEFLTLLNKEDRAFIVDIFGENFDPKILLHVDESTREQLIDFLGSDYLGRLLADLDSDEALHIIEDLKPRDLAEIVAAIPLKSRALIQQSLSYPEDSAGRLMKREIVVAPHHWTVGHVLDAIKLGYNIPQDFYTVMVVDIKHRPMGILRLSRLLKSPRATPVAEIMQTEFRPIPLTTDQEDVALIFRKYALVSAPVIDTNGRLVGVIMVDDVVDVIDEEAEEDLLHLAGLSSADASSTISRMAMDRFPWLLINLCVAVLASSVLWQFEKVLNQVVALAILMPIIPSLGGNAGAQTLIVAIRTISMRELTSANAWRVLGKEIIAGLANSVILGSLAALIATVWFDDYRLGLIMAIAIVCNIFIAVVVGVLVPLGLSKTRVDPAIASGVFLTTITDVTGFFVFLGLASMLLLG